MPSKEQPREAPPGESQEAVESGAPFSVELQSSNAAKYEVGQPFDNGEYRGRVAGVNLENNTITVEVGGEEDKGEAERRTVELQSSDAGRYKTGQRFDNGEYAGKITSIDFTHGTIKVELDDEGQEEKLAA